VSSVKLQDQEEEQEEQKEREAVHLEGVTFPGFPSDGLL